MSKLPDVGDGRLRRVGANVIRARQAEGIALARPRGVYKGRQPALTADQIEQARASITAGVPKAKIARDLSVSRQTLYTALNSPRAAGL